MATNIQNFKMSTYLELSCAYNGHWLLPCVAWLSLCYNLAIWLHCDLGQPGEPLCVDSPTLSTYQVLIVLTLLAYLAVLSDLATGKIKRLLADTGLAQIRERIRKLLSRGNNSVSPVEEFDLNDIPASVEYQESGNSHQNSQCIAILKDHIR